MNINIPDKLYKFLILIGVLLIAFSIYKKENSEEFYFSKIYEYRGIQDSLVISQIKIDDQRDRLIEISQSLAKTYEVENPIENNDSLIFFNRMLSGPTANLKVSDSIQKLWLNYKSLKFQMRLLDKKLEFEDKYLEEEKNLKNDYIDTYFKVLGIGFLLLFTGTFIWMNDSETNTKNYTKQYEKVYSYCQSCAKNFTSMRSYGTNKDKSLNYAFCIECFKKGKFREPELTKIEAKRRLYHTVQNRNWIVKLIVESRFARLERWL